MKQNFFEKKLILGKLILVVINFLFLLAIVFVVKLEIFQDAPGANKYSLYDKLQYALRCNNKRNIILRENKPNSTEIKIPPYDQKAKYRFSVDENGFIKPAKVHENPDLNIFFLGGSTTECEYVDEPYRFPYLVGRIIEEKTSKKINAYNAGKSGNNSIHSINNLVNKVLPLRPNIVVRMENINDLSTLLYEKTFWNKNRSRSNIGCQSKNFSKQRNFKSEWEQSPFREMIKDKNHQTEVKKEFRKILNLFVDITKSVGATPVLMTQFNKIETDENFVVKEGDRDFNDAYRKLYSDFQNITREVSQERNVILIDLAKKLTKNKFAGDKYLYDSVHLNNEGSQKAAALIAQELEKIILTKK